MKMRVALAVATLALGTLLGSAAAQATTYDLSGDFSTVNTSGSPWSIIYNNSALPIQPAVEDHDNHLEPAIPGAFFGTGPNLNADTPFAFKASENGEDAGLSNGDFLAGDVVIHSPNDGTNLAIIWKAPTAGVISNLDLAVWFAHSNQADRSNDVNFSIGSLVATDLHTSVSDNSTRPDPLSNIIQNGTVTVAADQLLTLTFAKTSGLYGSLSGVALSFEFQTAVTPIPATLPLFVSALAGLGWLARWRRQAAA
jgi:hypothetical protein